MAMIFPDFNNFEDIIEDSTITTVTIAGKLSRERCFYYGEVDVNRRLFHKRAFSNRITSLSLANIEVRGSQTRILRVSLIYLSSINRFSFTRSRNGVLPEMDKLLVPNLLSHVYSSISSIARITIGHFSGTSASPMNLLDLYCLGLIAVEVESVSAFNVNVVADRKLTTDEVRVFLSKYEIASRRRKLFGYFPFLINFIENHVFLSFVQHILNKKTSRFVRDSDFWKTNLSSFCLY